MASAVVFAPLSDEEQIKELSRMLKTGSPALVGPQGERMELPESIYRMLEDIIRHMKAGRAITLVPQKQQLTTQSTANMLGCSRPHVIKLLEAGKIPFQKVGQHRRVLLKDVLEFQNKRDAERRNALNELAQKEFEQRAYEGVPIEAGSDE